MTNRQPIERQVFFIETSNGPRLAIQYRPVGTPLGALIYVHPFAEEMNKSRRMISLAARRVASRGWSVLQVDLGGCGDSGGILEDMTWQSWLDDISGAWDWLDTECYSNICLWSLRAGSLLVSDWIRRETRSPPVFFWQPISDGHQYLQQFLRLKSASEMLGSNRSQNVVGKLRDDIKNEKIIEVAGYRVPPEIANGLDSAELTLPESYAAPVEIFEVYSQERKSPPPRLAQLIEKCRNQSTNICYRSVTGPTFWNTMEISESPLLLDAFENALQG